MILCGRIQNVDPPFNLLNTQYIPILTISSQRSKSNLYYMMKRRCDIQESVFGNMKLQKYYRDNV